MLNKGSGVRVLALMLCVGQALTAFGATRYVDPTASSIPDGQFLTEATAAHSIQVAVNASGFANTIMLMPGTYAPSEQIILNQPLSLRIRSQEGPANTIIDMLGQDRAFLLEGAGAAEIRGVTIRNGHARQEGRLGIYGGAIYIVDGGRVIDCVIENSRAEYGGGIRIVNAGSVQDSIVRNNIAEVNGGGIHIVGGGEVSHATVVEDNMALEHGGGIYVINGGSVSDIVLRNNTSDMFGGGIYIINAGSIVDSDIYGNEAVFGGGIRLQRREGVTTIPEVARCTVRNNRVRRYSSTTPGRGGGIHIVAGRVENAVVYDNEADGDGGGVALRGSAATLFNSTVAYNRAMSDGRGGGVYGSHGNVVNSIIYFNQASETQFRERSATTDNITYSYNLTFPAPPGDGNLAGEIPLFVDADMRDFRLQGNSPGIDAGTNIGAPTVDREGTPRPQRGQFLADQPLFDMGAYEYIMPSGDISGAVSYQGMFAGAASPDFNGDLFDPGAPYVIVVSSGGEVFTQVEVPESEGVYTISNMPLNVPLDITGYQDWNGNSEQDTWEPVGAYTNNPVTLTDPVTTGFDIVLDDSTTDTTGDGLRDFAEVFWYGTDHTITDSDGNSFSDYDEIVGPPDRYPPVGNPSDAPIDPWTDPNNPASFPATVGGVVTYDGLVSTNTAIIVRIEHADLGVIGEDILDDFGSYSFSWIPSLKTYTVTAFQSVTGGVDMASWDPQQSVSVTVQDNITDLDLELEDLDSDNDGLTDYEERFIYGTDPFDADTSGDGIPDGWLVFFDLDPTEDWATNVIGDADMTVFDKYAYSVDRLAPGADLDQDGLAFDPADGLNPLVLDTDGDGMPDGWEVYFGLDPLDPSDAGIGWEEHQDYIAQEEVPEHAEGTDPDGDGLSNLTEYEYSLERLGAGFDPADGLYPTSDDTDGDGMPDGWEVYFDLDPLDPDDAGISWNEHQSNILSDTSVSHTSAQDPDSDGLSNRTEYEFSLEYFDGEPFHPADGLNPRLIDTDGDGMPDGWEVRYWVTGGIQQPDPLVPDADEDPDEDGLTNVQEFLIGTDPTNPDTDGDGVPDGIEVEVGTDPLDPDSFPVIIEGTLTYESGFQSGPFILVATDVVNTGEVYTTAVTNAGPYTMDPIPNQTRYTMEVFIDTTDDGVREHWEAYGVYADTNGVPIEIDATNSPITGIDMVLEDPDSDGDGLTDYEEIFIYGSDPFDPDTSDDGVSDGWLVHFELAPTTNWTGITIGDADMTIVEKYTWSRDTLGAGFDPADGLDPRVLDTDGDGMPDGWEIFFGLDPLDPRDADEDADSDGLTNLEEYLYSLDLLGAGFDPADGLNPTDPDTSGDNLPDGWLAHFALSPLEQWATNIVGSADMTVSNTFSYSQERLGTNEIWNISLGLDFDPADGLDPTVADTDGDGRPDGFEIEWGSDPLDPDSFPIRLTGSVQNSTADPALTGMVYVAVFTMDGTNTVMTNNFLIGDIQTNETISAVIEYVPNQVPYWMKAYIDLPTNGVAHGAWDPWDPHGTFGDAENTFTFSDDDSFGPIAISNSMIDSDGDGLTDYDEVFIHGTDPFDPDTDGDGFTDGEEVALGTDPLDPDSFPVSLSGLVEYPDFSADIDLGMPTLMLIVTNTAGDSWIYNLGDYEDGAYATPTNLPTLDTYYITAFIDTDSDQAGLNEELDSWEPFGVPADSPLYITNDVFGLDVTILNPTIDSDEDGLTDFDEVFIYGTDPFDPDTDGDGFTDGEEVAVGSDPLDPFSFPIEMSGTISYSGPQTGVVYVVAVHTDGTITNALPISTDTTFSESYSVSNLISSITYTDIYAFRDSSGNMVQMPWEATGAYTNVPIVNPTNNLVDIDIELLDPGADVDSDGDGISDFDEVYIYGTDPFDPDTSGDGIPDGWLAHFYEESGQTTLHPTNNWATNIVGTADMTVSNKFAYSQEQLGTNENWDISMGLDFNPADGLNPLLEDTDGDGFGDGFELEWQSDPLNPDSFPVEIEAIIWNEATNTFATLGSTTGTLYMVFHYEQNANFFERFEVGEVSADTVITNVVAQYVPTLSNYWVSAFIDLPTNGVANGVQDSWDPVGYALGGTNSITPTNNMSVGIIEIEDSIVDTTGDGLTDFDEVFIYGTDPFNPDTDGDGFSDFEEIMIFGTDPLDPNSFPASIGGTITYAETNNVQSGTLFLQITNAVSTHVFDLGAFEAGSYQTPTNLPTLTNYYVTAFIDNTTNGILQAWHPQGRPAEHPFELTGDRTDIDIEIVHPDTDSDGDGLTDFEEIYIWGSDPDDPDTSGDGIPDGWLARFGLSPLTNWFGVTISPADMTVDEKFTYSQDRFGTNDTWDVSMGLDFDPADGLDPTVLDTDGDGLSDNDEINVWDSDPLNPDSSGDDIPDGWLAHFGLDPNENWAGITVEPADMPVDEKFEESQNRVGTVEHDDWDISMGLDFDPADGLNPTILDSDGDGLSDGDEVHIWGTDPLDPDTDGNGFTDYEEVMIIGSDPLNPVDPVVVNQNHPIHPNPLQGDFSDSHNGTRDFPFAFIDLGVDAAADGQVVLVKDGIYQGGRNRNINPQGKEITIRSLNGFEFTELKMDTGSGFIINNGEGTNTVIEGFTIRTDVEELGGAGILVDGASPILRNNRLFDCGQAGILVRGGGSPLILDSLFEENQSGIKVINSSPTIERCTLRFNRDVFGAGIFVEGSEAYTSRPVIVNTVIVQNEATEIGGGIYAGENTAPIVLHTTVADNTAEVRGGGMFNAGDMVFYNSIVWGNTAPVDPGVALERSFEMAFSVSQRERPTSVSVITQDPEFVGGLNYALQSTSPAIDLGTGNLPSELEDFVSLPDDDIEGNPRPEFVVSFPGYDAGAYEFIPGGSIAILSPGGTPDEVLLGGLPQQIAWTYEDDATVGTNLLLEYTYNFLSDPNIVWNVYATDIPRGMDGEGSYSWIVPTNQTDRLYIRLTDATNDRVTAVSEFAVSVRDGIRVLAPTGGVYYLGDTIDVEWISSPSTHTSVDLSFAADGASFAAGDGAIATNVPHTSGGVTNTYAWALPLDEDGIGFLGNTGAIQIDAEDLLAGETEDPLTVRGLVVTHPAAGASFTTGMPVNIRWTSFDAGDYVNLDLSDDGGMSYASVSTNVVNADGTNLYEWTASDVAISQAVLRVSSITNLNIVGISGTFVVTDDGTAVISSLGDGIPDWWRIQHGLDPENLDGRSGADYDADGDGMTIYEEWLAGTDPNDAGSYLGIVSAGLTSGDSGVAGHGAGDSARFTITWQTVPGNRYVIISTDDLDGEWTVVSDELTADGDQLSWLDPRDHVRQRYYRIVLVRD